MEILASIPSPSDSEVHLGPFPLRGYALCIILGVFLAIWLGSRRWVARGGRPGTVADVAVWAVPFGLVGARVYHVVTDYQLYFGDGEDWTDSFRIWDGGIGIWGAIAGGALGAWIGCRRRGIALPPMADAIAPGIAFAQAVGRWGNWFNQELYGRSTDLPWAVEIDNGIDEGTFHPTFLYESLWCLGVGALVIWADRRFRLGHGRAFALYVAAYTAGRFWIESLRIDEAHEFLGMRLNNWTSLLVFAAAVAYLIYSARRHPGREETVEPAAEDEDAANRSGDGDGDGDGDGGDTAAPDADAGRSGGEEAGAKEDATLPATPVAGAQAAPSGSADRSPDTAEDAPAPASASGDDADGTDTAERVPGTTGTADEAEAADAGTAAEAAPPAEPAATRAGVGEAGPEEHAPSPAGEGDDTAADASDADDAEAGRAESRAGSSRPAVPGPAADAGDSARAKRR